MEGVEGPTRPTSGNASRHLGAARMQPSSANLNAGRNANCPPDDGQLLLRSAPLDTLSVPRFYCVLCTSVDPTMPGGGGATLLGSLMADPHLSVRAALQFLQDGPAVSRSAAASLSPSWIRGRQ